jgi:transposase InsO family protein
LKQLSVRHYLPEVGRTWRCLAVVVDRYSRRVLGWSLNATKDARLTLAAFNTPHALSEDRLVALRFVRNMSRPCAITDNAHMEWFLETEVYSPVIALHLFRLGLSSNRGASPA